MGRRLQNMIVLDPGAIDGYLATLSGPDVVRTMFRLDEDERFAVLVALAPETAAEFIEDVPDEVAADLIEGLPVADAASIVTALPGHERADVLAEVEDDDRDRILDALAPETAADARELMSYPADSAGGLMVRDFLSFPPRTPAREVLETITLGRARPVPLPAAVLLRGRQRRSAARRGAHAQPGGCRSGCRDPRLDDPADGGQRRGGSRDTAPRTRLGLRNIAQFNADPTSGATMRLGHARG